ncbi:MAG: T9SS type A sorting domain-containing protein [Bacteroidota bacterium]
MTFKITRLTFALLLMGIFSFAQTRVIESNPQLLLPNPGIESDISFRMEMDTLAPAALDQACADTITAFSFQEQWGFITGNNGFGDRQKGQYFSIEESKSLEVTQLAAFMSGTVVNDGNIRANIYSVNSVGAPDQLLGTSLDVKVSEIAEFPGLTAFTFEQPVVVDDNEFIAVIDFNDLYESQDTAFIFHTNPGCGVGTEVWEQASNMSWFNFDEIYDADVSLGMFAFVTLGEEIEIPEMDTLFGGSFLSACDTVPNIFGITDRWGFITGTNEFMDLEKAQRFDYDGPGALEVSNVNVFFVAPGVVNNGNITLKIYSTNSNGSPNELLATSDSLAVSNIPGFPTPIVFSFGEGVAIPGSSFFASVDFSELYDSQDTLGIVHTSVDCGIAGTTYERFSTGEWVAMDNENGSWGLNINLYMIAEVNVAEVTSTNDVKDFIDGITVLSAFPNPAHSTLNLQYELAEREQLRYEVYHTNGQLIQAVDLGTQAAGYHQEAVDVSALPNGMYFYSLVSNRGKLVNRFVIQK